MPLKTNAVAHLGDAVGEVAAWKPPIRLNETTRAYFKRLASISPPEEAKRYRERAQPRPEAVAAADDYFLEHEPRHASMLRTSVSPTIIQGGYRINVIPSEAKATLDVRMHPDEDLDAFLEAVTKVVDDPTVEVAWAQRDVRPPSGSARARFRSLQGDRSQRHQALQDGDAADDEHRRDRHGVPARQGACSVTASARRSTSRTAPKASAPTAIRNAFSKASCYRFVRFHYDIVADLARAS